MEANATALAIAFYQQFQRIAGRNSVWAQIPLGASIKEVKEDLEKRHDRAGVYRRGNRAYSRSMRMLGPTLYQTLEFRGPKGSNDPDEILSWIDFMECVVKVANRKSIHGVKFSDLLKGERIAEYAKKCGLTSAMLNATVDENNLLKGVA